MNRELIKTYIDSQAVKVVAKLELDKSKRSEERRVGKECAI